VCEFPNYFEVRNFQGSPISTIDFRLLADRPGSRFRRFRSTSACTRKCSLDFPSRAMHWVFSEIDLSEDLKTIDVPTLILHGYVGQIVPVRSARRSSKAHPEWTLKVYFGAPHTLIASSKNQVNEDRLTFIRK
jgi:pimeloyl-ACP methyl ester carboxylesterase